MHLALPIGWEAGKVPPIFRAMPLRQRTPEASNKFNRGATPRRELIDPVLMAVGWDVDTPNHVGCELPVDGATPAAVQTIRTQLKHLTDAAQIYHPPLPLGISDYALYRPNGEIIAVVEAKKTSVDPRLAQAQAAFYGDGQPFAFMTNGEEISFRAVDAANKRPGPGFFSAEDRERLHFLRQQRQPRAGASITTSIADRPYQHEAIPRVVEAFDQGRRKALLVMATGTGKTRTALARIDLFLRTNQSRRVLFVADRDELVKQALDDGLKVHLPNELWARISSDTLDTTQTQRRYAAPLPPLRMGVESFSPGFCAVIIFDTVHRSMRQVERGAPVLRCADDRPDGYPGGVRRTQYVPRHRRSRRRADLPLFLPALEQEVSTTDTLRKQWHEIWEQCIKDASGQLPGKTIVVHIRVDPEKADNRFICWLLNLLLQRGFNSGRIGLQNRLWGGADDDHRDGADA